MPTGRFSSTIETIWCAMVVALAALLFAWALTAVDGDPPLIPVHHSHK